MMESLVLVDTSAWICFFSRHGYEEMKRKISFILDEGRAAIAGPILMELVQGTRNIAEKEKLKNYVRGLSWLSINDDHWHQSAELAFQLRRIGVTTSSIDTLIAVLAIDYHCILLHKDSDFDRISSHSPLVCHPF